MNAVQRGKCSIKAAAGCGNRREKQDCYDRGRIRESYAKCQPKFFTDYAKWLRRQFEKIARRLDIIKNIVFNEGRKFMWRKTL
jgi:hypothetical protein